MRNEFLYDNINLVQDYLCEMCKCNIDIINFFYYPNDKKWKAMVMNSDLDHFNLDQIELNESKLVKYIRKRKLESIKNEN